MRRIVLPSLATALIGSGALAALAIGTTSSPEDSQREVRPAAVRTLALEGSSATARERQQTTTEDFSMVAVSWPSAKARLSGKVEIRTHAAGSSTWSGWRGLEIADTPPDLGRDGSGKGMRGSTEPLWVGPSDGIEARVSGKRSLPASMRLDLVDPGTGGSPTAGSEFAAFTAESASPSPSPTSVTGPRCLDGRSTAPATPATGPVPKPAIISRAAWGADESIVQCPTVYSPAVKAVVVHHEAGSNSYSCAQSAAMVRSIQAFHVKTQGWGDIGYNFVVDKCGQIFEGSKGGVDKPVKARHTLGFNPDTVGVSLLGNMETAKPTSAALAAISRIAGWKLGLYGADPLSKTTLTAEFDNGRYTAGQQVETDRITSHQDLMATACPGANLHDRLANLRALTTSPTASAVRPTADLGRDGVSDLVAGMPKNASGSLTVVPGSLTGPSAAARKTLTQASSGVPGTAESGDSFGAATAVGDINGDGYADLAIGAPGEDDTSGNADRGAVTVLYGPSLTSGLSYTTVGTTAAGAKLGSAVTVGDFNADGKADVFSAGTGSGGSWNTRLTGSTTQYGTLTTATTQLAYEDAASGDFNRDGYADVALTYRDAAGIGRLVWFKGGRGGLAKAGLLSIKGGRSLAAGDINGDDIDDIAVGQPYTSESGAHAGGQVTAVYGTAGTGLTSTGATVVHQDTSGVPGAAESGDAMGTAVSVGDYNADGYADVLTGAPNEDITRNSVNQSDAGASILLKGSSTGLTGTGAQAISQDTTGVPGSTETGDNLGSSVSLTDLSGYGRADLTIGAAGEDTGNGALLGVPSNSTGLGLSTSTYYGSTQLGTPAGAHLGTTLTP